MFTIVISGPKSHLSQVSNVLAAAGLKAVASNHSHGHSEHANGAKTKGAQAFATVEGNDIDQVLGIVDQYGWQLRAHYHTPPPTTPSAEMMLISELESMRSRLDVLEKSA